MEFVIESLELILEYITQLGILLFEYVGVGIIVVSCIYGLMKYLRHDEDTRITLAKGLAMGLEFKLGSEILRTVIVRMERDFDCCGYYSFKSHAHFPYSLGN